MPSLDNLSPKVKEDKKSIQRNFRRLVRVIEKRETSLVCELPVPLKGFSFEAIEISNDYTFFPLSEEELQMLNNTRSRPEIIPDPTVVPESCSDGFCSWAGRVLDANSALSSGRRENQLFATYDFPIDLPYNRLDQLFDGEHTSRWWNWYALGFLKFNDSNRYGCIMCTINADERLEANCILRSELIALLVLLEFTSVFTLLGVPCYLPLTGKLATTQPPVVFLLSFTQVEVRVLEARIEDKKMIITIRTVLDKVPVGDVERNNKFRELIRYAMLKESRSDIPNLISRSKKSSRRKRSSTGHASLRSDSSFRSNASSGSTTGVSDNGRY
ncbi:hypothetical protein F4680DRAFT_422580 [Xylaria scruposa]|nr:hypothetical protein F4680DRAFT_422580 [Xylaria scruposa]